jgi:hypothetical protein
MSRLSLLFFLSLAVSARAETTLSGRWEGVVQIPDRELAVVVDLAQEDQAWTGSITIPGLNVEGAELSDIAAGVKDVTFAIKDALGAQQFGAAKFTGHWNPDGSLVGQFVQAGNRAPFRLRRIGSPQVEPPARSTAVSKELEGEWKGDYEAMGYVRHVTLKLSNRGAEGAAAEFVVVGRRTNNLPVDLLTQEGDNVTVSSHATGISYEARFNPSAGELKGTLFQGPIEAPLLLRRAK